MARAQIAARITGDDYQGRFFWWQALQLLIPGCNVCKVVIEHDKISGFDDVVVFYDPPIKADGGKLCSADYFQLKYHMNQADMYSTAVLKKKKRDDSSSQFEKLYKGFQTIAPDSEKRLSLVSNVCWSNDDPIAQCIRHDGKLSDDFFSKSKRSNIGKCRSELLSHLLEDPDLACDEFSFEKFARFLRFRVPFLNVEELLRLVNATALAAGVKQMDPTISSVPLDDLYRKLIQDGKTEFTKDSLLNMLTMENLMAEKSDISRSSLGVRSFMKFAENMERDCEKFECLCDLFDGRYIRDRKDWEVAFKRLEKFFADANLLQTVYSAENGRLFR